ncbi:MAG: tetratricopeptide repeat protein [Halothece sp.]
MRFFHSKRLFQAFTRSRFLDSTNFVFKLKQSLDPEEVEQVLQEVESLKQDNRILRNRIASLHKRDALIALTSLLLLVIILSISALVVQDDLMTIFSLVVFVVTIIGIFPASYVAYLFFQREAKIDRLKEELQLLGLSKKDGLGEIDRLYSNIYNPVQFIVYITLLIAISSLIFIVYYDIKSFDVNGGIHPIVALLEGDFVVDTVFYGFLGAYFYSIQLVIRRFNTSDLQPQVYSSVVLRTLLAVVITFSAASLIGSEYNEFWRVLAFLIGIFPGRGVRWISITVGRIISLNPDEYNERSLKKIFGINAWHEARLSELGIENIQNLATVDMRRLLLTTQFDTQQVVNWIDQAILHMKVGTKIDHYLENNISTFHQLQIALIKSVSSPSLQKESDRNFSDLSILGLIGIHSSDIPYLMDYSCYPNYAHIKEYYLAIADVAKENARRGKREILGALPCRFNEGANLGTDLKAELSLNQRRNLEEAIQELQMNLEMNSDNATLFSRLGNLYYQIGEIEAALDSYSYAIQLDENLAEAYSNRSYIYIEKQNFEQAIVDSSKAIEIYPSYAEAYNNRGLAYFLKDYFKLALEDFDEALRLDSRLGMAYYNRGTLYNTIAKGQDHFQQAYADFENAYLLGVTKSGLWSNWGLTLCNLGEYQDAITKLSYAINLAQDDSALAYARRGYAYLQQGEAYYGDAKLDFKNAIEHAKKGDYVQEKVLAEVYANYGLLTIRQGKIEEAIAKYQKAIEYGNTQFTTHSNLASAYHRAYQKNTASDERRRQQQLTKAIEHYEMALSLGNLPLQTQINLALAYQQAGNQKSAEDTLRKAQLQVEVILKKAQAQAEGTLEAVKVNTEMEVKDYLKIQENIGKQLQRIEKGQGE